MGRTAIDLTGQRYGSLTVTSRRGNSQAGQALWLCTCDCGLTTTVMSQNLRRGNTKRCPACTQKARRKQDMPTIAVDLYFYQVGQGGGFAIARDMATGTILAHSNNSRKPLEHPDPRLYPQMRNVALRLAEYGLIEPRGSHGWLRWYERERLQIKWHRAMARDELAALWQQALASGKGPKPDTEHEPLDHNERRRPCTDAV